METHMKTVIRTVNPPEVHAIVAIVNPYDETKTDFYRVLAVVAIEDNQYEVEYEEVI